MDLRDLTSSLILAFLSVLARADAPAGPPAGTVTTVIHDEDGARIADLAITGDAAKALFDFLQPAQTVGPTTTNLLTVTQKIGYGMSCNKLDQGLEDGTTATTYRCEQRLTSQGDATPGGIDPSIGVGN